jgi:Spy/CpxP family protein refolding chaperone
MKFHALALAGAMTAGLFAPTICLAQQNSPQPAPHGDRAMRRFANLNLSDQQRSQIQSLLQNYRQAHPKGSQPDPQARKALRQSIMGVLTPDQRAKLQAMRQQRRAQQQQRQPAQNPSPQP